jgi:hypothetical protein
VSSSGSGSGCGSVGVTNSWFSIVHGAPKSERNHTLRSHRRRAVMRGKRPAGRKRVPSREKRGAGPPNAESLISIRGGGGGGGGLGGGGGGGRARAR